MIQLSNVPTDSSRVHLSMMGYEPEEIATITVLRSAMAAMRSAECGQIILDYLKEKGYTFKATLEFVMWHDGNVVAKDEKGRRFVVIGSHWENGYVLRGLVRETHRGAAMNWLPNGQASRGSIQIAEIGERDTVPFPEFAEARKQYAATIKSLSVLKARQDARAKSDTP